MGRSKAAANPHLAAARLRELLCELEEERGSRSGAAEAVGLSRSYATKLMTGERVTVGQSAVDTVIAALQLRPEYFTLEKVEHHSQYLRPGASLQHSGREAYRGGAADAILHWLFGGAEDSARTLTDYASSGSRPPGSGAFSQASAAPVLGYAAAKLLLDAPILVVARAVVAAYERGEKLEALENAAEMSVVIEQASTALREHAHRDVLDWLESEAAVKKLSSI